MREPRGKILLETIKSQKSSQVVPSANGWKWKTLKPRVIFAKNTPETTAAENWFETEGGEAGAADATKIVMQNGMLKVLKTPDENTDFLNE